MTDATTLDALLPQLQCGRCGYGACAPYAQALARGEAAPDRCGPGGVDTARALALALGVPALPPDPACGQPVPPQVAWIDPQECIGCARCLPACPVDAIAGARKALHGVVAAQCTGCALCVPTCPVDCIHLHPLPAPDAAVQRERAVVSARRWQARVARLGLDPAPGQSPEQIRQAAARAATTAARRAVARPREAALAREPAVAPAAAPSAPAVASPAAPSAPAVAPMTGPVASIRPAASPAVRAALERAQAVLAGLRAKP